MEGTSRKNPRELAGRTENNRVVNFPGSAAIIGEMVDVTITRALPNSLRGIPLECNPPLQQAAAV